MEDNKNREEIVKEITKQIAEALKNMNLDFDVYGVSDKKVYKYDEKEKEVKKMIYITGDKHGDYDFIEEFCKYNKTTIDDILIILGDTGINYYLDDRAKELKEILSKYPITIFSVHDNHEERPENIPTYKTKEFNKGIVYYEEDYPNLLFAKDGEIYDFNGIKTLVIGGAYSVDKYIRISRGYNWYPSEQLTDKEKKDILNKVKKVDVVLSHTVPYKYIPKEMFLENINQSLVDNSMEYFLDDIEKILDYKKWYAGHYHTDKKIDKLQIMFNNIEKFTSKI